MLVRHPEAEPVAAGQQDLDRPLSEKGKQQLRDLRLAIRDITKDMPTYTLASPAARARAILDANCQDNIVTRLYYPDPSEPIGKTIHRGLDTVTTHTLVAHRRNSMRRAALSQWAHMAVEGIDDRLRRMNADRGHLVLMSHDIIVQALALEIAHIFSTKGLSRADHQLIMNAELQPSEALILDVDFQGRLVSVKRLTLEDIAFIVRSYGN